MDINLKNRVYNLIQKNGNISFCVEVKKDMNNSFDALARIIIDDKETKYTCNYSSDEIKRQLDKCIRDLFIGALDDTDYEDIVIKDFEERETKSNRINIDDMPNEVKEALNYVTNFPRVEGKTLAEIERSDPRLIEFLASDRWKEKYPNEFMYCRIISDWKKNSL